MTSAVSLAARAFVVGGTGTTDPNVVEGYLEQALTRYIAPFTSCTDQSDCTLTGIVYPASFWPFSFFPGWCVPGRCEKFDVSVEEGRANLHTALEPYLGTDEEIVIFGSSQGTAVISNEMRFLGDNYAPDQFDNISVVNIGSIDNRLGGVLSVLGFLGHIPILDVTTNLFNPIATGMEMTTINFQYDPAGTAPLYFNPLAILNALAAVPTVHSQYLAPNGSNPGPLPYGYTDETLAEQLDCAGTNNCKKDEFGNLYITIPATSLPMLNVLRSAVDGTVLRWLVDPLIALVEPALRVIIDTAYDPQADPGVVRYLSLLPFNPKTNLLKFGNDLFRASVQGVEDFFDAIFHSASVGVAPGAQASTMAAAETEDAAESAPGGDVGSGAGSEADADPAAPDHSVEVVVEAAVADFEVAGADTGADTGADKEAGDTTVEKVVDVVEPEVMVEAETTVEADAEAGIEKAREKVAEEASETGSGEVDASESDQDTQSESGETHNADTSQQAA